MSTLDLLESHSLTVNQAREREGLPRRLRIWKYTLGSGSSTPYLRRLPVGARLLHVDLLRTRPTLWFLVDPDGSSEERLFWVVGTGWEIHPSWTYLGSTVFEPLMDPDATVWHVFEDPGEA